MFIIIIGGDKIKKILFIKQESKSDCGIACLKCILSYYNIYPTNEYLKDVALYDGTGVTLFGLKKAFESLGFNCEALEGKINLENNYILPSIAHLVIDKNTNKYHYVVIYKMSASKLYIMDPSKGKYSLTAEEFFDRSTNYYLFIKPTSFLKIIERYKVVTNILNEQIKNKKNYFILFLIISLVSLSMEFATFFELKIFLNYALIPENLQNMYTLIIPFVLISFLKIIADYLLFNYQLILKLFISKTLANKVINKLLSLPITSLKRSENEKIFSIFQDTKFISEFFIEQKLIFIRTIPLLLVLYLIFLKVSLGVFLFLLTSNIFFLLLVIFQKKGLGKHLQNYYYQRDKFNSLVSSTYHFFEMIKGYHYEKDKSKELNNSMTSYFVTTSSLEKYKEKTKNLFLLIENINYFSLFFLLSVLLISTKRINNLSTFIFLESLIGVTLKNEETLIVQLLSKKEYKESIDRLDDFFLLKRELLLKYSPDIYGKELDITVNNLSFSYGLNQLLKNINLTIPFKSHIFFYGKSGSGKSTLFKLLGRYLEPEFGMININELDITHYNLADLRNDISYVTSNILIENKSLLENITMGRKVNMNSINKILKVTGLNNILASKDRNIHTINEMELNSLSTGEKMRIACARALYRNSKIYLFDECFSNMDIKSERQLLINIFNNYKDATILYISHRLENKDLFARKYVLKDGTIYEEK
mgnify:FL=1